jgi:hypothetical protein
MTQDFSGSNYLKQNKVNKTRLAAAGLVLPQPVPICLYALQMGRRAIFQCTVYWGP